jgi:hypothetical protein
MWNNLFSCRLEFNASLNSLNRYLLSASSIASTRRDWDCCDGVTLTAILH